MNIDFVGFDLETLKTLYTKYNGELEQSLLDGASWTEVQDKRKIVTELSILIHKHYDSAGSSENEASHEAN